jgi:thymidylate kinase
MIPGQFPSTALREGEHAPESVHGAMTGRPPLDLVRELCEALRTRGLLYCHWKSNAMLDDSASGENDLDLLVSRSDVGLFTEILYRLGFKEARVSRARQIPGVLHYYGYDGAGDRFVHVHAHYQLVLGDDMTKNYHLPIEKPYLHSAVQEDLLRVPPAEFELLLLILRVTLKYSTWDAFLRGQGRVPRGARRELEYLRERADPSRVYELLQMHLPYVDRVTFDRCMQSLQPGCWWWTRVNAARRLQACLRGQGRLSSASDLYLKHWRRASIVARRLTRGRSSRKRLASGGALIALVGGDGAGKSTAVKDLHNWLSRNFSTMTLHLGRPFRPTLPLSLWHRLRIGRRLPTFAQGQPPVRATLGGVGHRARSLRLWDYLGLVRCLLIARARYRAYVKGRRFATNGGLVICDRYPLSQITLMDWSKSSQMLEAVKTNGFVRLVARAEQRYYQRIPPPELLMVLRVHPTTAVERKPDEDPASVRRRSQEIWDLDWGLAPARIIDASRTREEVLSELKGAIWSAL